MLLRSRHKSGGAAVVLDKPLVAKVLRSRGEAGLCQAGAAGGWDAAGFYEASLLRGCCGAGTLPLIAVDSSWRCGCEAGTELEPARPR